MLRLFKTIFKKAFLAVFCALAISNVALAQEPECRGKGEPCWIDQYPAAVTSLKNIYGHNALNGDLFATMLFRNYRSFATYEADVMQDRRSGEWFALKAIQAHQGLRVPPENPSTWNIPASSKFMVDDAFNRLIWALDNEAADHFPELMAEAQSKYDCWVEQLNENYQPDDIAVCYKKYYTAMLRLEDLLRAPKPKLAKKPAPKAPTIEEEADYLGRMPAIPNVDGLYDTRDAAPAKSATPAQPMQQIINIYVPETKIQAPTAPVVNVQIPSTTAAPAAAVCPKGEKLECPEPDECECEETTVTVKIKDNEEPPKKRPSEPVRATTVEIENTANVALPEIKPFEVYFDWDKANVDSMYARVLKDVATKLKDVPGVKIVLTGHTDTTGSQQYNYGLGLRRANAVKNELVKYGMKAASIETHSKGKTQLKVKTADGVRNPQNRRTEFKLGEEQTKAPAAVKIPAKTTRVEGKEAPIDTSKVVVTPAKVKVSETITIEEVEEDDEDLADDEDDDESLESDEVITTEIEIEIPEDGTLDK